jgi:hypothetical protein
MTHELFLLAAGVVLGFELVTLQAQSLVLYCLSHASSPYMMNDKGKIKFSDTVP